MARKLNKGRIDEILKTSSYENTTISYPGINSDVVITLEPNCKLDKRTASIWTGIELIWGDDGEYISGLEVFGYSYALLDCFANLKLDEVAKIAELVYNTSLIHDVEEALPDNVVKTFKEDFYKSLEYVKECRSKSSKAEELYDIIIQMIDSFNETISSFGTEEDMKSIVAAANKLTGMSDKDIVGNILKAENK